MNIVLWVIGGVMMFLAAGTVLFYYLIGQAMKSSSPKEGWLIKIIMPVMRIYGVLMIMVMFFTPSNFKKSIKKILP